MKYIKKTIILQEGQNVNILVDINLSPKVIGVYDIVNNNTNYNATTSNIIKGKTSSRLTEVETYNPNQKYMLNVNGVTEITNEYVKYTINSINYTTNLSDNQTTFEVVNNYEITDNTGNLINNDNIIGLIENPSFDKKIKVNRNFISALDQVLKILPLKSIPEIEDYGVSTFKIVGN